MEQVVIGNYIIGHDSVEVILREGDGGEFWFIPDLGKSPRIKVGADADWECLLGTFIHEVTELSMAKKQLRYLASEDLSNDHSGYLFIMTHVEFSDCCNRMAEAMVAAQKDLKKAWKAWHKAKRKEQKQAKKEVD